MLTDFRLRGSRTEKMPGSGGAHDRYYSMENVQKVASERYKRYARGGNRAILRVKVACWLRHTS